MLEQQIVSARREQISDVVRHWSPQEVEESPDVAHVLLLLRRSWPYGRDDFDEHILPFVRHAIEFYGPLPGSQSDHHGRKNGLILHALDVAHRALKTIPGIAERGEELKGSRKAANEGQYYKIIILAALLHDVGKPISDVLVRDLRDLHRVWYPWNETLASFCRRGDSWAIGWQWQPGRHRNHERFPPIMAGYWLEKLGVELTESMFNRLYAALFREEQSVEWNVIRKLDGQSAAEDKRMRTHFAADGKDGLALLRDATTTLFRNGDWRINQPGKPVWVTEGGVFLVHDAAFRHLLDQVARIPGQDEETHFVQPAEIVRKLQSAGLLYEHRSSENPNEVVEIFLPDTLKKGSKPLRGVRLTDPEALGIDSSAAKKVKLRVHTDRDGEPLRSDKQPEQGATGDSCGTESDDTAAPEPTREQRSSGRTLLKYLTTSPHYTESLRIDEGGVFAEWPTAFSGLGLAEESVLEHFQALGWAGGPERGGDGKTYIVLAGKAEEEIRAAVERAGAGTRTTRAAGEDGEEEEMPELAAEFFGWLRREDPENLTFLKAPDPEADGVTIIDDGTHITLTPSVQYNFLAATGQAASRQELVDALLMLGWCKQVEHGVRLSEGTSKQLREAHAS